MHSVQKWNIWNINRALNTHRKAVENWKMFFAVNIKYFLDAAESEIEKASEGRDTGHKMMEVQGQSRVGGILSALWE